MDNGPPSITQNITGMANYMDEMVDIEKTLDNNNRKRRSDDDDDDKGSTNRSSVLGARRIFIDPSRSHNDGRLLPKTTSSEQPGPYVPPTSNDLNMPVQQIEYPRPKKYPLVQGSPPIQSNTSEAPAEGVRAQHDDGSVHVVPRLNILPVNRSNSNNEVQASGSVNNQTMLSPVYAVESPSTVDLMTWNSSCFVRTNNDQAEKDEVVRKKWSSANDVNEKKTKLRLNSLPASP